MTYSTIIYVFSFPIIPWIFSSSRKNTTAKRIYTIVIPSRCAHRRGNLPDHSRNLYCGDCQKVNCPRGQERPPWGAPVCGLVRNDGGHLLLLAEGLAVGALVHSRICLMGTHQDALQGAEVCVLAVVCTLCNGAFNALVCMAVHSH